MRLLTALTALSFLAACAGPAPGEPHPFDIYMQRDAVSLPKTDTVPNCANYGCIRR